MKITIDGSVIETVEKYKYLGVILDTKLDFGLQVEYSIGKAKRASAKVCSLINGRSGLPVQVGLNLYKALVRPHLEYALPVWANIYDKDLQKLEQAQLQCLRRVMGAKSHSSSSAVEVVGNILPFAIRKRELCCREYIRIISERTSHPIVQLLNCTMRVGMKFCPLEYICVMSRQLQRQLEDCILQDVQGIQGARLSNRIVSVDSVDQNISQMDKGNSQMVIFTDGSVYGHPVGCGACAAVCR